MTSIPWTDAPGYEYVGYEEFGKKNPMTGFSERSHATPMSAEEFADEVRPFMRYRPKLQNALEALFERWRTEQVRQMKLREAEDRAEAQKKRQSEQNARWLENMLNNRR